MEEKIIEYIRSHQGCRLREIGEALGVWHPTLIHTMYKLQSEGRVAATIHNDMANMDNYIMYYVLE